MEQRSYNDWIAGVSGAELPPSAVQSYREGPLNFAGFVRPFVVHSDGQAYTLQPNIAQRYVYAWIAAPNTSTPTIIGITAGTVVGTQTVRLITLGSSLLNASRRVGYVSAATAGATAGLRQIIGFLYASNTADRGGFLSVVRFGISATSADARLFVGVSANVGAPTNVDPNTINNSIGVGKIAAAANLQFITRNATTTTTTDLGASFPAAANAMYEVGIYVAKNSAAFNLYVRRIDVPAYIEFLNVTVNVPVQNTLLTWNHWICNNATLAAVSIEVISQYAEVQQ